MENEEKPKPKFAQLFASFSFFSINRQTFADLPNIFAFRKRKCFALIRFL